MPENGMAEKLRLCQHLETAAGHAAQRGANEVAIDLQSQIDELLDEVAAAESHLINSVVLPNNMQVGIHLLTSEESHSLFKPQLNP